MFAGILLWSLIAHSLIFRELGMFLFPASHVTLVLYLHIRSKVHDSLTGTVLDHCGPQGGSDIEIVNLFNDLS